MRRGRRERADLDAWPAIADSFVGILAVVVFLFIGYRPPDPDVERFKNELRERFETARRQGILEDFRLSAYEARIVYSAESLSFETCDWQLPAHKAAVVQAHLRPFAQRSELIRLIRIEGHADRRSSESCTGVVPYRDNLQLSQNRARAVYNVLLGLAPKQQRGLSAALEEGQDEGAPEGLAFLRQLNRQGRLQTAGFGDTLPRDPEAPENPINRRVEIVIAFVERDD
jgi:hypothetical protein